MNPPVKGCAPFSKAMEDGKRKGWGLREESGLEKTKLSQDGWNDGLFATEVGQVVQIPLQKDMKEQTAKRNFNVHQKPKSI